MSHHAWSHPAMSCPEFISISGVDVELELLGGVSITTCEPIHSLCFSVHSDNHYLDKLVIDFFGVARVPLHHLS